jgi:Flp pilus assembly protein TadD
VIAGAIWMVMVLMSASLREPIGTAPKPNIILPPPVSTAQTPIGTDTAVAQPDAQPVVTASSKVPAGNEVLRPTASDVRSVTRQPVTNASSPDRVLVGAPESTPAAPVTAPAPAPVQSRVDYEAQATAAFNAGDLSGARDKFQLATRFAPTARAWTNYGVTLQRLGDNAGASAAYQSAIGIDANYLEAWLYQGRLVAALGDIGRAIPLFQRARSINPRNADVNIELARLEYDARNFTEARRFAEEAARADQSNYRGHWYLAVASDQLKDGETALRAYTAYLRTVGDDEREQAQFVGFARQRVAALGGRP